MTENSFINPPEKREQKAVNSAAGQIPSSPVEGVEEYRALFLNSPLAYQSLDGKGRFLRVNPAWLETLGYEMEEVIGHDFAEFLHPEDRSRFQTGFRDFKKEGHVQGFEFRLRHKSGRYMDISFDGRIGYQPDGGFQKTYSVLQDISEKTVAEKVFKELTQTLKQAQRVAQIGSFWYDPETKTPIWTEEMFRIFGVDPESGAPSYEEHRPFIHTEDWDRFDEAVTKAVTRGIGYDLEIRIVRPDGSIRHVNARSVPRKNDEGKVVQLIGTVQDITERKEMETRIRQAQRMEAIGNLAGGIAHDFNNILSPILGMAELLLRDLSPETREYENAKAILKAGRRGSELVKQILAFSRRAEHALAPVRLQNIIKEVLKLIRATLPSSIEIVERVQPDCGRLMADPTQLHQVLMNLITNAAHAVESQGGRITVQLSETTLEEDDVKHNEMKAGRHALLSISDTGHGISADLLPRIFEPYFTTKGKEKGTGLGLSVAHGIIREHKGDIRVQSVVGKGTTFDIYLPIMEESREKDSLVILDPGHSPRGVERILLVDDEEPVANFQTRMLQRLGYTVTSFTSSTQALSRFKKDPNAFDLVITDMDMPEMTGDLLARNLIAIRPDIPVIMCTGYSDKINRDQSKEMGIKCFMIKPVVASDLARKVREALGCKD